MTDWQPERYLDFADERARPARDLLAQVPLAAPARVYDLGCGPGNSTGLLVARYPQAQVTGIDNSPAMLEAARKACPDACFAQGDLVDWRPPDTPDLLFSNAALQWVPHHLGVMERLAGDLPAGGVLAVQLPDNLDEPSHRHMRAAAERGPWAAKLRDAAAARDPLPGAGDYYARLKPHFRRLDIWHAVYNHPLDGIQGIVSWLGTTGLRPFLAPLDASERAAYLETYSVLLEDAYPVHADGKVLLRFPRLFIVGSR